MKLKNLVLSMALGSLAIAGCNGSSSSSDSSTGQVTVSGTATAPSGSVALLRHYTAFDQLLNSIISPVYASMTGLDVVENALVELIEIDDEGNQVGDVIASTYTSTTGNYKITVPDTYQLNGSLVLRISGSNNLELRAQAVDSEVNINPISEYVLQKYISLDVDLSALTLSSVVELYGKLDEYDLSSSTDLATTLSALAEEVGEFVESSIETSSSSDLDANELDGNYRILGYESKLVDNNTLDTGIADNGIGFKARRRSVSIDGDSNGSITATYNSGIAAYRRVLNGVDGGSTSMSDTKTNTYPTSSTDTGTYLEGNVLLFTSDFEEIISTDDNEGERVYPQIQRFQKVNDSNIAINLYKDASAFYGLEGSAINDDDLIAHQVYRGLRVMAQVPTSMSQSDLTGDFGRVYIEAFGDENANVSYLTANNILSFDGSSTFSHDQTTWQEITRDSSGTNNYESGNDDAASGISITVDTDGNISQLGGDNYEDGNMNGFVNADYNFLAVSQFDTDLESGIDVEIGTTLAVKLPTSTPLVQGKTYRIMTFGSKLDGREVHLLTNTFNGKATFVTESTGTVTSAENNLYLAKLGSEDVTVEVDDEVTSSFTAVITSNGAAILTSTGTDGDETSTSTLTGYFNETASMGIFTTTYQVGSNNPKEIGLAVLIQID
ncbi:hypothetical protein [Vibrio ziniensis]|uniref:Uncharacterized protein n=1 Tax=Vibrio ziniensis TaxID=2711221 RepID=A0A6G7CPB0_9VIBR|nr:hypothetical protein [Vibrio ziniensis]QIH43932.1 hypothetical protein G5S32_18300 [Vibrio ziniensis]